MVRIIDHPFFFSFSFGSSMIVVLTGMLFDMLTLSLFGSSKISIYLIAMDLIMFFISLFSLLLQMTDLYWDVNAVFYGLYLSVYSSFAYFQYHGMLTKTNRIVLTITNTLLCIEYIVFCLAIRGFFPDSISKLILIINLILGPFPIVYLTFAAKNVRIIEENPIYHENPKQKTLRYILLANLRTLFSLGTIFLTLLTIGIVLNNGLLFDISIIFPCYLTLILSFTNMCIQLNKSLINTVTVTGSSLLYTTSAK